MSAGGDSLLAAWVALTRILAPAGPLVLRRRRAAGKEDPDRWPERLGVETGAAPDGRPTVWIHAASVGETVAALPLIGRIAGTGVRVLLTTVTTTSAAVAAARLPAGAVHRFVPLDLAPFIDRFLARWKPGLAIFVESEIWPVAVSRLAAAGIPLVVANARMSDRSFRGWRRFPGASSAIFGRVALCLAQSGEDARRFEALGAGDVRDTGNIKFDAPVPEAAPAVAAALSEAIGSRPVFLAASTHPGEEDQVLDAFADVLRAEPRTLLVLAPRHPARGAEVAAAAAARELPTLVRSSGALPAGATAVYVADTVGELGTLYALATAAFVGGSLAAFGGHNPIEPARMGTPVVTGPDVANFREAFAALEAAGAVAVAADAGALAAEVLRLIREPSTREARIAAGSGVVARHAGAVDRTFEAIRPMVEALSAGTPIGGGR